MNKDEKMIDPELKIYGWAAQRIMNYKDEADFRRFQKLINHRKGRIPKDLSYEERYITTGQGRQLRILIFYPPKRSENAIGVLWLHGGGYAIGAPDQDDYYYKLLLKAKDCVIVAPDYSLSIDLPYPAALEDCYESLLWMKQNASELGIRRDQLFVAGNSAGGGLTAAVTIYARDRREVSIAFQMPIYPMLDDRMITPSSMNNHTPVWDSQKNEAAWKLYLGSLYGTDQVPPYAAPARLTDFSGLPPAYTFVGDLEPFYNETLIYIEALKKAGIPAEVDVYPGCFHGFDAVARKSTVSRRAQGKLMEAFIYAAEHYFAQQPD